MVFHNRFAAVLLLSTSGLLAACAVPNENVITRASQVDAALTDRGGDCRYDAISVSLAEEIKTQEDADALFKRLTNACPGLQIGSAAEGGLGFTVRTVSVDDSSFSNPQGPEISPTLVGNNGESGRGGSGGGSETGSGNGSDGGSGGGGQDGGASGTESANGGGSDTEGPGGDDSGDGPDSEGSQGLGESQGGIGGGNNGGGNGETE